MNTKSTGINAMANNVTFSGTSPKERPSSASSSDVDFSDTFETDCDSITTEISFAGFGSSSPSLLKRYFDNMGVCSETDSWSTNSLVTYFRPGGVVSLPRTSPDGQSSPDDVMESEPNEFLFNDSFKSGHLFDSSAHEHNAETPVSIINDTPLFSPLSRPLFQLGAYSKSSETVHHVKTPAPTPSLIQTPFLDTRCPNWPINDKEIDGSLGNSALKQDTEDVGISTNGLVTDTDLNVLQGDSVGHHAAACLEKPPDHTGSEDTFKHAVAQRSLSLPNVNFNFATRHPSQLHLQSEQNNSDPFRYPKNSDIDDFHLKDKSKQNLGLKPYSHRKMFNNNEADSSLVSGLDNMSSLFSSTSDQRFTRSSRRPSRIVSDGIVDHRKYHQTVHPLKEPSPQDLRKHLPNPFNKINHRFHSTLHCPCFIFFCFLCCYPAVYLMQRSDIKFISGDDNLARRHGKRATVLYIVGGISSVVFISTLLLVVYFFLGDDLIKTT